MTNIPVKWLQLLLLPLLPLSTNELKIAQEDAIEVIEDPPAVEVTHQVPDIVEEATNNIIKDAVAIDGINELIQRKVKTLLNISTYNI